MHDIIAGIQTRIFPWFHRLFNYRNRICRKTMPTTTWQKREKKKNSRTSNKIIETNDNFPKKSISLRAASMVNYFIYFEIHHSKANILCTTQFWHSKLDFGSKFWRKSMFSFKCETIVWISVLHAQWSKWRGRIK